MWAQRGRNCSQKSQVALKRAFIVSVQLTHKRKRVVFSCGVAHALQLPQRLAQSEQAVRSAADALLAGKCLPVRVPCGYVIFRFFFFTAPPTPAPPPPPRMAPAAPGVRRSGRALRS